MSTKNELIISTDPFSCPKHNLNLRTVFSHISNIIENSDMYLHSYVKTFSKRHSIFSVAVNRVNNDIQVQIVLMETR